MGAPEPSARLQPRRPPGRADRKAGAYNSEILRLRGEGYTYAAIREALEDVGIDVSVCALRREVRRRTDQSPLAHSVTRPNAVQATMPSAVPDPPQVTRPLLPPHATGREIAEAYFKANPSNPLLRVKEHA